MPAISNAQAPLPVPSSATEAQGFIPEAGGYEPAVANRFIAKLREKIEQGRALGARIANR